METYVAIATKEHKQWQHFKEAIDMSISAKVSALSPLLLLRS